MKILLIGDVFGKKGIFAIQKELKKLKKEKNIDFVIANAENTTKCRGLQNDDYEDLIEAGVDFITMGNHTWKHRDIDSLLKDKNNIIRPLNIHSSSILSTIGVGYRIVNVNNKKIRIINLLGTSLRFELAKLNNPFLELEELLKNGDEVDFNILDFHSETTSEKNCMLRAFQSRIEIIVGTHTHVQTNDAHIDNSTAYITDLGMTGPSKGIIGADQTSLIEMFYERSTRFALLESNTSYQFCGLIVEIDDETNKPIGVENIYIRE